MVTVTGSVRKDRNTVESAKSHIAIVGSSSAFGAASTGATPPKWLNSWPGKLRQLLDASYGAYGTGLVIANKDLPGNPTWDPRWAYAGTVNLTGWGYSKSSVFTTVAGSGNYVEFTPTISVNSFVVYLMAGSAGIVNYTIDGGTAHTIRNLTTGGATPDIEKEAGYRADHIVTIIPAGTLGAHTIRLWGNGGDMNLYGIEGRTGNAGISLSNPSISSKSLSSMWAGSGNNDEVTGHYGLPMIDSLKATLMLVELGGNDWQNAVDVITIKSWLTTLIARQSAAGGGTLLYLQPIPSTALQPGGGPLWADYGTAWQQVASATGTPFLDHSYLFGPDYTTGNAAGMYADTIHPSDAGAAVIAASVKTFLGL